MGFRNQCLQLSMKNYRLMREYREIYHYHHGDILNQCVDKYKNGQMYYSENDIDNDLKSYVQYVLQNDNINKMESYEWIQESINRIHHYIQMCYYLSFIGPSDVLEMKLNLIYVNLATESILNKRNRKLEKIINQISDDYKLELYTIWSNTDKHYSNKILTQVPCKWIMYEYRKIFRYLYCTKYFNHIYTSFDKDYTEFEHIVFELCQTLGYLFRENSDTHYLSHSSINFFVSMSDLWIILLDNFVTINLITYFTIEGSLIIPGLLLFLFYFFSHTVVREIINMIKKIDNKMNDPQDLEHVDSIIETVFNEMKVMLFDGKTKIKSIH